jgi:hypothetical protein
MFKKNNNAFLELECQEPAKRKLAELIEMPIKGIKKVLIRTSGSNGLTNFLKTFMVQITIKNKLGDRVMYFSRDKMDTYNHYPPEFLNQMFYMCCPKVIIIDDFQLFFEYSTFWNRILDLIERTGMKNVLIVAGMNEERLYEKDSVNKICDEFYTIATIERPTTVDVVNLSESILTDYNPISDINHQLNLDLKTLVSEIEREAGYPEKVSYK